jgi:site-specific DNA-adenine methylase
MSHKTLGLLASFVILAVALTLKLGSYQGALSYAQSGSVSGIYTYHYDNMRTGLNAAETILTPANVNSATFEKIYSDAVDGQMYAEPLYVEKRERSRQRHAQRRIRRDRE